MENKEVNSEKVKGEIRNGKIDNFFDDLKIFILVNFLPNGKIGLESRF